MIFALVCAIVAPLPASGVESRPATGAAPHTTSAGVAPAARQARNVFVLTIDGPITRVTAYSIKRRLEAAVREGADAVVFELNTPGGEVGATLEICDAIKNSPIANTVAWVHTTAYSAGAFIALACREIVVAESATMGDAAPIAAIPGLGMKNLSATERQKILAPILTEIVDSARRGGYDELLVQAFVSLGVELWLVEEKGTGKRYFVSEREYRLLFEGDPVRTAPRMASGSVGDPQAVPTSGGESGGGGASEGAPGGETTSANERAPEPASDPTAFRPASPSVAGAAPDVNMGLTSVSGRPVFSARDKGRFDLVEYATDGKTLLVLKTDDMRRYGLAQATVRSDEELKQFFAAQEIHRRGSTWSEGLALFLMNIVVRGALVAVFMIALFLEMATPGLGLAGGIAAVCGLALLAPPVLIGAAGWWTAVAVVTGVVLILGEILVFPGVMVLGVAGAGLFIAGLVGSFVSGDRGAMSTEIVHGLAATMLGIFVAGVCVYFIGKSYGTLPIFNRLILGASASDDEASGAGLLAAMGVAETPVLIGATGIAVTTLRPSGTAEVDGRLLDVVSEIGFIDSGAMVRVTSVTPYRIGVERAPAPGNTPGNVPGHSTASPPSGAAPSERRPA